MARVLITRFNRSPLIHILTWFFFFVGLFLLVVRQVTRSALSAAFMIWDYLIIIAVIISFAQSILVSRAAASGLGKSIQSLGEFQIQSVLKANYVATILFIASMGMSKLSAVYFTRSLSPDQTHYRVSNAIVGATLLWMITGITVAIFQCAPPRTWDMLRSGQCIDLMAWWTFFSVGNILTDISIVAVQALLLRGLQMARLSKLLLLMIFSFRLIVVGVTIAQVVVHHKSVDLHDVTLNLWLPVVLNEVVQSMQISAACIPHIKRFLENLESGMIRVEEPEAQRGTELQDTGRTGASGSSGGSGLSAKLTLGLRISSRSRATSETQR